MKLNFINSVCFVLISAFVSFGQAAGPTPALYSEGTLAEMKRIQTSALSAVFAYDQTAYLTNNIGPRLSGSAQAERAVQYVAEQMRKMNLEVRLQPVKVPRWIRGVETGEIVQFEGMAAGTTQKIVLTALGGSIATPETGTTADVVVVNDFAELARLGTAGVKGKIVLFNNKFDRELQASGFGGRAYGQAVQYRFGGAAAAARLGAVAALVRSAGGSQNRLAHTGVMGYADGVAKIPAAAVSYEDAETIAYLSRMGNVRVKLILTPKLMPEAPSFNVIGDIRGSEKPDEVVVISGHLDSWDLGTGALDDAAGVAVAMQTAYLLKDLGIRPKRTIRIIAWMNEENGGAGSRAYFAEQSGAVARHFAAIESDLGASHPVGFKFAGKAEALPYLAPVSALLASQGAGGSELNPEVGADIDPLTKKGVPSFSPWFDQRTYFNYHHTAADTLDKIDPKELAEVGSLTAVLAYALANLEVSLPR